MHYFAPKKLLCVAAHPDDIEFCAAGSIAQWAGQGCEVYYLVCTDGSKGTSDSTLSPESVIATRQQEQHAAAEILGVKEVFFLTNCDGELECKMDLKKEITGYIRRIKPTAVHCLDPTFVYSAEHNYINHSDHRAVGQATLDAVYPMARDHSNFPEQVEQYGTHKVTTLLMTNLNTHNLEINITDQFGTKIKALMAHASQIPSDGPEAAIEFFKNLNGTDKGYSEKFVRLELS